MKFKSDFSSRFRILKGGKISLMVSALLGGVTLSVAAPTAGVVTSGTANISQSGNTTNINQSSNKATINWQDFSIKSNETVNFNQPNKNSITLNRVVGNEKSVIDGVLNANGQVWILNSNGVLFNKTAKVNTAGIVATTKELSDADFNAGNYEFKGDSKASVINIGTIEVSNSAYVVLASNEVKNQGTIKAVKGKVYLSGADKYSLNLNGNSLVSLSVKKGVLDALVENSGTVIANGGEIYLSTNAVNELLKGVVNNTGILEANSLDGVTGKVELFAHGGEVQVGGTIKAKDGFVETSGKKFSIDKNTNIKAKTWLIDPTNLTVNDATAYETALGNGTDTLIKTDNATGSDEGNIYINDTINWTTNAKLTLDAYNNIYINKAISATNGKLALYYGDSGDYYINAKVNLSAGQNFFTKKANDSVETSWTVVTTASDVQNMSLSGNTVLGADVDASGISNWTPIGNFSPKFTGNFDGLGHTIDKLVHIIVDPSDISNNYNVGLFGYTDGATIRNIGVTNVNINGDENVGGLVGWNNNSIIKNSYANGTVNGNNFVGGLIGLNDLNSTIENSYASGIVSGSQFVGGLVGSNIDSTIENSYASVKVIADTSELGGLVGSDSSSTSPINSWYDNETNTDVSMGDSHLGKTKADILAAFAGNTTWVTTGADIVGYGIFDNGISLPLLKTFATPTSTLFESGYGTEESAYTITNWTQLQNINNSNILTKNYYFQLLNNLGDTTSDYVNLASSTANGGAGWNSLGNGSAQFKGNFDGLGHTIDKLYINNNTDEFVGLFGYTNEATIRNVGLTNVDITASYEKANVGALVGKNENSTINNSYAIGSVNANGEYSSVGGLVGWNHFNSTINNSYARGSVTSSVEGGTVGGLVGLNNNSSINNSYATGSVAGNGEYSEVGGLIGSGYLSTINNSYASGSVTVKNELGESYSGGLYGRNRSSAAPTNSWYDNEANTDSSMIDTSYGKTKEEILNAFTSLTTDWGTTGGGGSSVSGYEVILLPYLTGVTRDEDKSKGTLFESGMGVSGNAYKITNWTQLQNINNSNILTKNYYFQLLNNLGDTTSDYANLASSTANGGAGWNPLGNGSAQFKGNFDGLGHTISDLYINRPTSYYIGLFGYTNGATIRNISTEGTIIGSFYVGGLVGYLYGSTVEDSYSNVTVSGNDYVGGLVGFTDASTIKNSYATGTVSGTTTVGGLVGYNGANSSIENSYASGTVEGVVNVGGLVGNNDSTIKNSYASGTVEGGHGVGGLVGVSFPLIENSYYDKDTNTDSSMDDISYGKTKAEILALVGGTWDNTIWSKISGGSSVEGYEILELPYLIGVTRDEAKSVVLLFNSGLGTSVNPYTIKNWTQLQNINNSNILTQNYYFQLLNNLNSSSSGYTNLASSTANDGAGWNPLGKNDSLAFTGNFDGLGHTIDSLYINRPNMDNVGLFGLINGSTIKNIGLINTTVTGKDYVGALVGLNKQSIVKNVYSSNGSISGKNSLGGLIGNNINFSNITNSYASGSVTGIGSTFFTGGLVGSNSSSSTIENSYFTGSITGHSYVGGLVGVSTLDAGIIKDSFYNNETSNFNGVGGNGSNGNPVSGVTGLTTAQMSYGQIFKNASWDIVADSSVISSTPVLKYDSINDKYVWAIAPLSLSYNLGTKTSEYNGLTQNLSSFYTTATSIFGNDYSFLDGTYKFQVNETDVTGYKNAATYENIKVASTNDFLNIASSGNTDGTLTIAKKAIKVSADDLNKIYGQTDASLTYTTTGLVGNDTLSGSLKRVTGENVGEYVISQDTTLSNSNYTVTFTNGKYTITPKAITVSADDLSKIYGQTDASLTYTATGLVGNDTLSGSLKRVTGENVGEYVISQDTTLSNSNYTVTFTNGKYTITPKAITVSAENKSKTQGENNPSLTYVVNGLIGNDILIGNLSTTATVSSDVGTYEITQGDLANGNYAITFNDGELTVLAKNTPTPNPEPTPTPNPEPTPTPPDLSKIIDNIDKTTRVNVPNRSFISSIAPTNSTQSNNLVSTPIDGQELKKVDSVNLNTNRVSLNDNSIIQLINGGVKLPNGVNQEFYGLNNNQIGETN